MDINNTGPTKTLSPSCSKRRLSNEPKQSKKKSRKIPAAEPQVSEQQSGSLINDAPHDFGKKASKGAGLDHDGAAIDEHEISVTNSKCKHAEDNASDEKSCGIAVVDFPQVNCNLDEGIGNENFSFNTQTEGSKDIYERMKHLDDCQLGITTKNLSENLINDFLENMPHPDFSNEKSKLEIKPSLPSNYAPTLKEFLLPGATLKFRPRPEWYSLPPNHTNQPSQETSKEATEFSDIDATLKTMNDDAIDFFLEEEDDFHSAQQIPDKESQKEADGYHQPYIFGRYRDSAIHIAIRGNATEAALCLIAHCSDESFFNVQNGKGVTPLKVASRKGNLTVVKELLRRGADPSVPSFTKNTALSDACQFGHGPIVEDLLLSSNDINQETRSSKTDAAYRLALLDQASGTDTTSLMRASDNGHVNVVKILLHQYLKAAYEGSVDSFRSRRARKLLALYINRRNKAQMTALLLASQCGHAEICRLLIEYGSMHDDHGNDTNGVVDASSNEDTSLLLACKREHLDVARVLAESSCELFQKDSRGRTAYDILSAKLLSFHSSNASNNRKMENIRDLISVLDPVVQVELMQKAVARSRNWEILRFWHLLQTQRACVLVDHKNSVPIHSVEDVLDGTHVSVRRYGLPYKLRSQREQALLRTMTLPLSLVQCIVQYIPVPLIWNRRLRVLTKRCFVNAIAAVSGSLDLIDEVLELGGFVEACDIANDILPPNSSTFKSWKDWKTWRQNQQISRKQMNDVNVVNSDDGSEVNSALVVPLDEGHHNIRVQLSTLYVSDAYRTDVVNRRTGEFMQQMAHRSKNLVSVLTGSPYNMDADLIQKLITLSDIASVVRRMGIQTRSIHLEPSIGMDFVMLATRLCSWLGVILFALSLAFRDVDMAYRIFAFKVYKLYFELLQYLITSSMHCAVCMYRCRVYGQHVYELLRAVDNLLAAVSCSLDLIDKALKEWERLENMESQSLNNQKTNSMIVNFDGSSEAADVVNSALLVRLDQRPHNISAQLSTMMSC